MQGEGPLEQPREQPPATEAVRSAKWPYWIVVPFCGITYSAYCTWFLIEAWGGRGAPRPAWFDTAYVFAVPGMYIIPIPIVGSFFVGGLAGFLTVLVVKQLVAN